MKNKLLMFFALVGILNVFCFGYYAVTYYEAQRFHATRLVGWSPFDTTAAPFYRGEIRMRRVGTDTSFYMYTGRAAGRRRWFPLPAVSSKITDADIARWNTYNFLVNTGALDTLLVPVNDSTFAIKSIRVVAGDGITVNRTVSGTEVLYTVSIPAPNPRP
jgi:hypothetical protein